MNEATNPITAYQYFIASPYFAGLSSANDDGVKAFANSYISLSQPLKDFIASEETATTITLVAIKYELEEKQISQLAQTLRELVLGSIFIKDLPNTLTTKLGVDEAKAQEIINKIVSESFGPIIEDVKRIQRSKFPDKIMQLQKEARPEGLNPKPQIPEGIKNMPLNRPSPIQAQSQKQAPQQIQTSPQPAVQRPPQSQSIPPLQSGSVRPPSVAPQPQPVQPTTPKPNLPPQLPQPQPGSRTSESAFGAPRQSSEVSLPGKPPVQSQSQPQKPAFKIPDIGQSFSATIGNLSKEITDKPAPENQAKKSLEAELEKVSSVIDLRNKP